MGFIERLTRPGVKGMIRSMMTTATDVENEKQQVADAKALKALNDKINDVNSIVRVHGSSSSIISQVLTDMDSRATVTRVEYTRWGRLVQCVIYFTVSQTVSGGMVLGCLVDKPYNNNSIVPVFGVVSNKYTFVNMAYISYTQKITIYANYGNLEPSINYAFQATYIREY